MSDKVIHRTRTIANVQLLGCSSQRDSRILELCVKALYRGSLQMMKGLSVLTYLSPVPNVYCKCSRAFLICTNVEPHRSKPRFSGPYSQRPAFGSRSCTLGKSRPFVRAVIARASMSIRIRYEYSHHKTSDSVTHQIQESATGSSATLLRTPAAIQ